MTIKAELVITPSEMRVIFGAEQGEIRISAQMKKGGVALYYLARRVVAIDKAPETFDAVATIFPPLHEEGELAKELATVLAGENSPAKLSEFTEQAVTVLARIGYPLEKAADKITDTASKKPARRSIVGTKQSVRLNFLVTRGKVKRRSFGKSATRCC